MAKQNNWDEMKANLPRVNTWHMETYCKQVPQATTTHSLELVRKLNSKELRSQFHGAIRIENRKL